MLSPHYEPLIKFYFHVYFADEYGIIRLISLLENKHPL